jgi:hypothetical protein
MSFVAGFSCLRELHLKVDTIPKPCGFGSGGPRGGLSVRSLSGFCPELVRCTLMQLWRPVEDNFQDILSKVTKKSGRGAPVWNGTAN